MEEKSYNELMTLDNYHDRLEYLKLLDGNVSSPRHMSSGFYKSPLWLRIRKNVMQRDGAFDLGIFGMYIEGPVYVHHINPIEEEDILNLSQKLTSMNNLVCASLNSHNAIHYKPMIDEYIERKPGDTKLW